MCRNGLKRDLRSYSAKGFDRGASRFREALWFAIRGLFFLSWAPYPSGFRTFLLRVFGAKVGKRTVIRSRVNVSFPWRLSLGDDVWIGEDVHILSLAPVVLESNVCVSQRAFICTGSHDFRRSDFALRTKPITLRSGSWVAAGAFIGPGVEIGNEAVVSAGSVVMQSIPPRAIAQGNPARVVRTVDAELDK